MDTIETNPSGAVPPPASGSANRRTVSLGALEPPLVEQLDGLADKAKLEQLDRAADAITHLYVHGLLTDRETDAARRRLMARVKRTVEGSPSDQALQRGEKKP